jgi:hypothetical protein
VNGKKIKKYFKRKTAQRKSYLKLEKRSITSYFKLKRKFLLPLIAGLIHSKVSLKGKRIGESLCRLA